MGLLLTDLIISLTLYFFFSFHNWLPPNSWLLQSFVFLCHACPCISIWNKSGIDSDNNWNTFIRQIHMEHTDTRVKPRVAFSKVDSQAIRSMSRGRKDCWNHSCYVYITETTGPLTFRQRDMLRYWTSSVIKQVLAPQSLHKLPGTTETERDSPWDFRVPSLVYIPRCQLIGGLLSNKLLQYI